MPTNRPRLHFSNLELADVYGDIVETYRLAAESLGYPTSSAAGKIDSEAINLLFFYWTVPWEQIAPHRSHCILVNFEPLADGSHAFNERYLETLRHGYRWDYSRTNFHNASGLALGAGDYVPLAYQEGAAPCATSGPDEPAQDIDVLFFGLLTPRRAAVFEQLRARGLRLKLTDGGTYWTSAQRDAYMRRAKVVVNFHRMDNHRMVEIHRLSILFRNRKAVVTELYPDSEIDPGLREAVVGVPYERLVEAICDLVADASLRARLERAGLAAFMRLQQTSFLGVALDRFLQWQAQQAPLHTPNPALSVSVCLAGPTSTAAWRDTLASIQQQTHHRIELLLAPDSTAASMTVARSPDVDALADAGRIVLWTGWHDTPATAWNAALTQAGGDYLVFVCAGDLLSPERLERQLAFMVLHPHIDVLGCALHGGASGDPAQTFPELNHEIQAELLGSAPLLLSACMVRSSFMKRAGIRFDPEQAQDTGLHFLCKCAAYGASFATLREPLHRPVQVADTPPDAVHARPLPRTPLLAYFFPFLPGKDIQLLAQLHATHWPPEREFAERMLCALSRAALPEQDPPHEQVGKEALVRVLRRDAIRLLRIFFQAGLVDQAWIDRQFADAMVAQFLAPAGRELPTRPNTTS